MDNFNSENKFFDTEMKLAKRLANIKIQILCPLVSLALLVISCFWDNPFYNGWKFTVGFFLVCFALLLSFVSWLWYFTKNEYLRRNRGEKDKYIYVPISLSYIIATVGCFLLYWEYVILDFGGPQKYYAYVPHIMLSLSIFGLGWFLGLRNKVRGTFLFFGVSIIVICCYIAVQIIGFVNNGVCIEQIIRGTAFITYHFSVGLIFVNLTIGPSIDYNSKKINKNSLLYEIADALDRAFCRLFHIAVVDNSEIENTDKDQINKKLDDINKKVDCLGDKVERGFDDVTGRLDQILCWCSTYTTAKKKELNGTQDEELISKFINETANGIVERLYDENFIKSSNYIQSAENELKGLFGLYWDKLDCYTRRSLVSAKVFLAQSQTLDTANLDFSGIVVSATSALENELKLRLFIGFQDYLVSKQIPISNWPTLLKFFNNETKMWIRNTDFTLGKLSWLLYPENKSERPIVNEYLKTILHDDKKTYGSGAFSYNNPESFISRCKSITIDFRNKAAHTEPVIKDLAEKCCDNIIGVSQRVGEIQGLLLELLRLTDNYSNSDL